MPARHQVSSILEPPSAAPRSRPPVPASARGALDLAAVLPVWDEGEVVAEVVGQLVELAGPREVILVVSDRSGEETRRAIASLQERHPEVRVVPQVGQTGLGRAVRLGLAATSAEWVLMMDSDGEMDVATVPRMIAEQARTGADLVVGARWLPGGGVSGYDPFKKVLNRGFQLLFRILYRVPLHDLTLGFKLLKGDLARSLPWSGVLHEIAVETTLRPFRAGAKVAEVPTVWTQRRAGVSKNTFWRNFRYVRMALEVLRSPAGVR